MTTVVDHRRRATRATLIRAATGLFRRRGVAATSVADVCARSGVTKGVFSHHFPGGRAELAAEVIRQNGQAVAAQLRAAATGASPAALIATIFSAYAGLMETKGSDFGCPVAASVVDGAIVDPGVGAAARAAFASWRETFSAAVGDDDLADLIVAALEGAILLACATDDPHAVRRIGRQLGSLVERTDRPIGRSRKHRSQ